MPGARIRVVFFDAGFTLIQSEIPLPERCARIAREHGIEVTAEALAAALPGGPMLHSWYREDPDLWASDERLESRWREYYVTMLNDAGAKGELLACAAAIYTEYNRPGAWSLYPDVLPTLQALHEQGYTLGVISDWASTLPANILLPLGVGRYVSHMVVSGAVREAKPGYGLYREALARAGAQAHEAVHVGDSYVNDILGARAAGIRGILLDRRGIHSAPLDCPRIASLTELPALLPGLD
jgi:putative hydrolase of the HAD superfamily